VNDYIHWRKELRPVQPDPFPQSPLHPIARDRTSHDFSHRKSNPKPISCTPAKKKHRHVSSEMTLTLLIHAFEVGMPQQPRRAWKRCALSGTRHVGKALRSNVAHVHHPDSDCGTPADPEGKIYSRKPGFTDTRLRPLARRRESTACPPFVFIRVRNPCVFER